jgi:hypothetical protein
MARGCSEIPGGILGWSILLGGFYVENVERVEGIKSCHNSRISPIIFFIF